MKLRLKPILLAAVLLGPIPAQSEVNNDWIIPSLRSACDATGTCWQYFGPPKRDRGPEQRGPEPKPYWKQWGFWQSYYRPAVWPYWDAERNYDRFRHYWPRRVRWQDRRHTPFVHAGPVPQIATFGPIEREPYPERDRPYCVHDITRAVGIERYGREEAREAAEQAWMETVRSKWGARFMDPRNARERTFECYRSGTERPEWDRRRDVVEQCEIVARACRSRLERD